MRKSKDNTVILNDEQMVYLRHYEKLTSTSIGEVVRRAVEDWIDVSYPGEVYRIEKERGLPASTTLEVSA